MNLNEFMENFRRGEIVISFAKNVYLVEGAVNSCVYDLNSKKIYHLIATETNFIKSIVGQEKMKLQFDDEEKDAFNYLLSQNIIVDAELKDFNDGDIHKVQFPSTNINMAWIEVTKKCNLFCKHCYEESNISNQSEMDLQDFEHVVNELEEIGVKAIQLIGGEPLIIGEKLKTMIEYARSRFDSIEIFSNGNLIDEDWIDFFKKNDVKIALSLYSYIPEMHDKVTSVKGSHSMTISAISCLKENGIPFRIASVMMKDVEIGSRDTDMFHIKLKKDIVRMSGRASLDLLDKELMMKKLITKNSFASPLNVNLICRAVQGHNCFSRRLYIDSDLEVYPCVMERRIKHGSLVKNHLADIIDSKILELSKDYIEECKRCEFRYCCHDCRSDTITDNVFAKPWVCTYNPEIGEWANPEEYCHIVMEQNTRNNVFL